MSRCKDNSGWQVVKIKRQKNIFVILFNCCSNFLFIIHCFHIVLFYCLLLAIYFLAFFPAYGSLFEPYFLAYSAEEVIYMQALNVLSEGKESAGNNAAGCALENKKSVSFGFTYLNFKDNLSNIKLFLPKKFGNLGLSLRYANFGETEFVSENFDVKKEKLYSVILNTSLGKEMFIPGLFLGIDLNFGNIKLDETIQTFGTSFGARYIINFVSTELHLGSVFGSYFAKNEDLFFYAFGIKYYLPEYKSFLSLAYNKNIYEFLTTTFEIDLTKNFLFIVGYETMKGLTNYSVGGKFKIKNFEFVFSTKYNKYLYFTPSLTISYCL